VNDNRLQGAGPHDYGGVAIFARQLRHTPGSIQIRALERPANMKKINRDARRQAGRASAWVLALMCCLQPAAQATEPASTPATDCGCHSSFDESREAVTPIQQALFEAARQADADAFLRLLPVAGDVSDVSMGGEPLVSAIIRPDPQLKSRDRDWGWTRSPERERLFDTHRATLAARQRMLSAALAQGARTNLVTYHSRVPALQLAIVFGSPEMVDDLLQHGANPKQANQDRNLTPLEFLLDHEFFLRLRGLPELLTRQERARIVASLLKAGSPQPEIVNWTDVVSLVAGDAWLTQLLSQQAPTADDLADTGQSASPTAAAAYLGDEQALNTLFKHLPKQRPAQYQPDKNPPFDLQLDAALAALLGGHTQLARSLLRADMPWAQEGPQGAPRLGQYVQIDSEGPVTALEAAIGRGDTGLATQLLDWGAPTGDGLKAAIHVRDEALVRLLIQRGANPVEYRSYHSDGSPLTWVIEQAPELLPALLSQPSEATIKALREEAPQLLRQALESPKANQASQRPLVEALLKAGVNGSELSAAMLHWAIRAGDLGAIEALHAGQAPWPPQAVADALSTGQADLIERVSQLSGQPLSQSCPQDYESLNRLVREAPPFADRLLDQGLQTGSCGKAGPLSHRLLAAWVAPESRPLMGTRFQRAQALLQRLWLADPAERDLPAPLLEGPITQHRPDVLALALAARPVTPDTLGTLAQVALDARNPQALGLMRSHGLSGTTRLPDGQTLTWHLGCDKPATWRPLAGFADLPAPSCPAHAKKAPTREEKALAAKLPGTYYLSGVREVGSQLRLRADGRFSQATSYGAIDAFVEGHWQVQGKEIVFQGKDTLPTPFMRVLKAWHEPGVKGVEVRASSGGRLMQGFVVMTVGSEISYLGKLRPRDDEGWTRFDGPPALGRLEGLAIGVAWADGLRWTLMPLQPDAQGQLPNRIEVDVNLEAQTPPGRSFRLRLDKGDLVSADDESGRARFQRSSRN